MNITGSLNIIKGLKMKKSCGERIFKPTSKKGGGDSQFDCIFPYARYLRHFWTDLVVFYVTSSIVIIFC